MSNWTSQLAALIASGADASTSPKFEGCSGAVQTALKDSYEKSQKAASEAIAAELNGVLGAVKQAVTQLRADRKSVADSAKQVKKLDVAARYFLKTSNLLPFAKVSGSLSLGRRYCDAMGLDTPGEKDSAWDVPTDFDPASVPLKV